MIFWEKMKYAALYLWDGNTKLKRIGAECLMHFSRTRIKCLADLLNREIDNRKVSIAINYDLPNYFPNIRANSKSASRAKQGGMHLKLFSSNPTLMAWISWVIISLHSSGISSDFINNCNCSSIQAFRLSSILIFLSKDSKFRMNFTS